MKKIFLTLTLFVLFITLIGCQPNTVQIQSNDLPKPIENENNESQKPTDQNNTNKESIIDKNANENGKIMILMYHGIGEKEEEWVRTSENFKKDLEVLYNKGYRLISLTDYINNNIKTEAGFTPVVITFDDGLKNQFNMIEQNGENRIDPDCAVGILEDFYRQHHDFGRGTSFFVYYPVPFRQKELIKEKFEFLIKNEYEIGNHSYDHPNLGKISIDEVEKQLALNVKNTKAYISDYTVTSLALPYGGAPKGEDYKHVVSGEYEGTSYLNQAVLLVGSNPALSPINSKFDPTKLPRVRASELKTAGTGIYDWLAYFDKNPEKRYISDGDPNVITIPDNEEQNINKDKLAGKELRLYSK